MEQQNKQYNVFQLARGIFITIFAAISFAMLIFYTFPQLSRFRMLDVEPSKIWDILITLSIDASLILQSIFALLAATRPEAERKQAFSYTIVVTIICFVLSSILIAQSAVMFHYDQETPSKFPTFMFAVFSLIPVAILQLIGFVLSIFNIRSLLKKKTLKE